MNPTQNAIGDPVAGAARRSPIPSAGVKKLPPQFDPFDSEAPIKPVNTLGVENLLAGGGALRLAGGPAFLAAGKFAVKAAAGSSIAEALIGFFATSGIKPAENIIHDIKEHIFTQPPTPGPGGPVIDLGAPFRAIGEPLIEQFGSAQRIADLHAEQRARAREDAIAAVQPLLKEAQRISELPPSPQTVAALQQLEAQIERFEIHPTFGVLPNFPGVAALEQALKRHQAEAQLIEQLGERKGPGGVFNFYDIRIDP